MSSKKVDPLFLERLRNPLKSQIIKEFVNKNFKKEEELFRIIISFENPQDREIFLSENENLNILGNINLIPSVILTLKKEEILNFDELKLVSRIEEDQRLYLSMLDVIQLIEQETYRDSQMVYTGDMVQIGIIDNGIKKEFDCISPILKAEYSLANDRTKDPVTHGTLLANIIGNQYLDEEDRTVGIAPNAEIIDFNIFNTKEEYYLSDILQIFDLIIREKIELDILLIPMATLHPSYGKDILSRACNLLVEENMLIVCPAGNFGAESKSIGSPGAAKKVITVGSINKKGKVAYFSGRGPTLDGRRKPDLVFPGSKIEIPLSNETRIQFSGTSVSAAIATGIIALLREYDRQITHEQILSILNSTALDLYQSKDSQGKGTTDIVRIFKHLNYYEEQIIPYTYMMKRSLRSSIEFIALLIGIYYIVFFFNIFQFLTF